MIFSPRTALSALILLTRLTQTCGTSVIILSYCGRTAREDVCVLGGGCYLSILTHTACCRDLFISKRADGRLRPCLFPAGVRLRVPWTLATTSWGS